MTKSCFLIVVSSCLIQGIAVQSGQLTAADVDDNLNFDWYLKYKSKQSMPSLPNLGLGDRVLINVTDENGAPFSCAIVEIPQLQLELPSGTNGLLPLFPSLDKLTGASVEVRAKAPGGTCPQDCSLLVSTNESASVSLQVPASSLPPSQLDVAFIVDTTGSMCDELTYLQAEVFGVLSIAQAQSGKSVDTRLASILYKDQGDAYIVQATPFGPSDANGAPITALKQGACSGGGDYPEAMNKAMEAAVQLQWRAGNTARVAFLVADAPPHDSDMQATLNAALALRKTGVKVYGLAASGVGDTAEYVMRLMAVITGARHLWLTDDSGIGNAHQEPKVLCYQVTRLDQLLARILSSELSGSRVEALPSQIIRQVGQQEKGICLIDFQPATTTTTTSLGGDSERTASPEPGDSVSKTALTKRPAVGLGTISVAFAFAFSSLSA